MASVAEVNSPGAYSAVCVEMDLNGLAVTTVLQVSSGKESARNRNGQFGTYAEFVPWVSRSQIQ